MARVAILSVAVLAAMVWTAPPAPAVGTCTPGDVPEVFPVDDLEKGMEGVGWTVIDGTTQTSFDVEILGVDESGIAPGVDFILAQITGPASFLNQTGGIVAGMSGSPVYIDDKLVGSTSYGFSGADQTIMGITPAEEMVKVFEYPAAPADEHKPSAAAMRDARMREAAKAREVRLSADLRQAAAKASGDRAAAFGRAKQLPVPLSVSGVDARGLRIMRGFLKRMGLPVHAYASSGSTSAAPADDPLTAGDGMAAALSYGDVSAGGIGTATATCGNLVLGWGHPFFWQGPVTFGMNGADVLKVIRDPSSIFGGFKFAVMTDLHGTVDQDRLTAIRGIEGLRPTIVPITTDVTNVDLNRSRQGGSRAVAEQFIPPIAADTLLGNLDVVFDRIGDGSVRLNWIVRGIGPDGERFKLDRDNRYFSEFDVTFESVFEMYGQLLALQDNRFGEVEFKRIHLVGDVTQDRVTTSIRRVLSASTSHPALQERKRLVVRPGDTIRLRVVLQDFGAAAQRTVNMQFQVPEDTNASFGELTVRGGQSRFCGFGGCRGESFEDLIRLLEDGEHNYDLVAQMRLGGGGGVEEPPPGELGRENGQRAVRAKIVVPQDEVVLGSRFLEIRVAQGRG